MKHTVNRIQTLPELCSGCRVCQLTCSFIWARQFNPAQSRILIEETADASGFTIAFTDGCNTCGVCARYCSYGALRIEPREPTS